MVRVLRIIARLNVGGPAIHVVNLNAGLDPERYESHLVSGSENAGEGSMGDFARCRGVHAIAVPEMVGEASLKPRDINALLRLVKLVRQIRPHILHTHTAKAGFLGRVAARIARVPVIVHTYHGHVLHSYYGPAKTRVLQRMEQALALVSDQIVTVSEGVKRDLVSYGIAPAEKIRVIPLGFDLEPFLQSGVLRGQFRSEIGIRNGAPLIGIVGRLFPIKNHRLFLEAAANVMRAIPASGFVIVGDGVLRGELERLANQLGIADHVSFTGWRRDLDRIYSDLDILVVSSDNEGTPVSAIEAMASGRPVVATNVGGLPDIICDGETGRLVPPRDAEALSRAILDVINNPDMAARMGQKARAEASKRFNLQRLISDTERLYENLLAKKGIIV